MIKTEEIKIVKEIVVLKICDWCDKEVTKKDVIDWQEFIHINEVGGYGSVFGDGEQIKLDICQDCFYEIFYFCMKYFFHKLEE